MIENECFRPLLLIITLVIERKDYTFHILPHNFVKLTFFLLGTMLILDLIHEK